MSPKLFTEQEVSAWLRVPVATLRTMRSRPGKDPIPFVKIGRLVRYREDQLMKWLERNNFNDTEESSAHRRAG